MAMGSEFIKARRVCFAGHKDNRELNMGDNNLKYQFENIGMTFSDRSFMRIVYDILTSFLSTMLRYLSKFTSFIPAAPERAVSKLSSSSQAVCSKQISRKMSSASAFVDVSKCIVPAKNTAVIFIEYQNEFTTPGGKLYDAVKECMQANNALENSREFAEKAREEGAQVVHVPIIFEEVRRCYG